MENTVFNHSLLMMREKILNQFTQSMSTQPLSTQVALSTQQTTPNQDRRRGQFGRYNQQFKLEVAQFAIKEGNSAACSYRFLNHKHRFKSLFKSIFLSGILIFGWNIGYNIQKTYLF